jgi:kynureninase
MIALWTHLHDERLSACGLQLITPRDPARRGSRESFAHPHAYAICRALGERDVIGDCREPSWMHSSGETSATSVANT